MAEVPDETQEEVARIGQHWEPNYSPAQLLGRGWKVRPCLLIKSGTSSTIMDVEGPGVIQQIWMTPSGLWRHAILRFYWDDNEIPSVECPMGVSVPHRQSLPAVSFAA